MTEIFLVVFVAGAFVAFYLNNKKKVDKVASGIEGCIQQINPEKKKKKK
jgi:hypothetical protein